MLAILISLAWSSVPQHTKAEADRWYQWYCSGPADLDAIRFRMAQADEGPDADTRRRGREGLIRLFKTLHDRGCRHGIVTNFRYLGTEMAPHLAELDQCLQVESDPVIQRNLTRTLCDIRRQIALQQDGGLGVPERLQPAAPPPLFSLAWSCLSPEFRLNLTRSRKRYIRGYADRYVFNYREKQAEDGPDEETRRRGREALIRLMKTMRDSDVRAFIPEVFSRLRRNAEPYLPALQRCWEEETDLEIKSNLEHILKQLRYEIRQAQNDEQQRTNANRHR